jgi:hypothetical protein
MALFVALTIAAALRSAQRKRAAAISLSARPDAGGEGFDGVEAEFFVELDGGAVFRGYGQR